MKAFKKLVAVSLLFSMALSLAGCSGKDDSDNTEVTESTSVSASEVQTTETELTIIETEEISTPNLLKIDQQIAAIKDAIATIPAIAIGIIHFFSLFFFFLGYYDRMCLLTRCE